MPKPTAPKPTTPKPTVPKPAVPVQTAPICTRRTSSWPNPSVRLRSLERRAEITNDRATEAAADLRAVPFMSYSTAHLAARIWTLRGRFTVCDAHYVALAEALGAPLVTGDRRLASAAADLIEVLVV